MKRNKRTKYRPKKRKLASTPRKKRSPPGPPLDGPALVDLWIEEDTTLRAREQSAHATPAPDRPDEE